MPTNLRLLPAAFCFSSSAFPIKSGSLIEKESPFGVVESVKTVSDLYAPVSGKVTKVNTELETHPENVNSEPYGKGWIVEIEISDVKELESLLDPEAYTEQCQKEQE